MTHQDKSWQDYEKPSDIIADSSLSHDDRIRILKFWAKDAEAKARAAGEGMSGSDEDTAFLAEISKLLLELGVDEDKIMDLQ